MPIIASAGGCSGPVTSNGYNLDTDGSCNLIATGDLSNVDDAGLGALADNGGDTMTHALLPDSPAIDAGTATCSVDTDQRGVARPQSSACDIGAYELGYLPDLQVVKTASNLTPLSGEVVTYTVAISNTGTATATNVTLTDNLPTGMTLVSTDGCAGDPNGLPICALGDIAPAGQATVTYQVTISATSGTVLTNTASVTSTETSDTPTVGTVAITVQMGPDTIVLSPISTTIGLEGMPVPTTLTATVKNGDGEPIMGRTVDFSIISGPHAGMTGTMATNAEGIATFTYNGTNAGTDVVEASMDIGYERQAIVTSNQAEVRWVTPLAVHLQEVHATQTPTMLTLWIVLTTLIATLLTVRLLMRKIRWTVKPTVHLISEI